MSRLGGLREAVEHVDAAIQAIAGANDSLLSAIGEGTTTTSLESMWHDARRIRAQLMRMIANEEDRRFTH